jgi:hypothetical protein
MNRMTRCLAKTRSRRGRSWSRRSAGR